MSAAPAHAARGMELALQDDSTFVAERGLTRKAALRLADQLFVSRIRVNLPWDAIVNSPRDTERPKRRHYDFTSYDVLWKKARAHGIKLQMTIAGPAPAWATGDHYISNYEVNVKYFKEFVHAVAKHFRGLVDRYSIWNEPNWASWNGPLSSAPERYRAMYATAYREIKSIDPRAKVLIGETAPYGRAGGVSMRPLKFLRDVVKAGPLEADGYAHHAYDFRHRIDYRYPGADNVTMSTLGRLTAQLDKLARSGRLLTPAGKPLDVYVTEFGYMESGKDRVPESKRSKYVTKGFQIALDNPRVKEMLQYLLVRPPPKWTFDTGIVSRGGKKTPTFKALAAWARKQARAKRIALRMRPRR